MDMPRLILLNNQPSGWSSLALGAAQGLGQGLLAQDAEARKLAERRAVMADQMAYADRQYDQRRSDQLADYSRSVADRRADVAGQRSWQESQAMAAEQRRIADEARKRSMDAGDAAKFQDVLEGQGLIPGETPMPDGVAGPGTRPPRLSRPEDVRALAGLYGQEQARRAMEANRVRDDERAQQTADQRAEYQRQQLDIARQRLTTAAQRKDLTPDQQNEVRAAVAAMNDPNATREDYAAAYVTAMRLGYAPVGAAVQRREDPQDSAEARAARAEIAQVEKVAASLERKVGSENRKRAEESRGMIKGMWDEYVRKFGGARPAPAQSPPLPTEPMDLTNDDIADMVDEDIRRRSGGVLR